MNIIKEKQKIKEQIDLISDSEFLKVLKDLLAYAKERKYSTPLTQDEYDAKLQESEVAYKNGKIIKHADVIKSVDNWEKTKK